MAMFRTSGRRVAVVAAALSLLVTACTSTVEISSGFEAPTEEAVEAVVAGLTDDGDLPLTAATAARFVPAGWSDLDADSYQVAVPGSWSAFTDTSEIDSLFEGVAGDAPIPASAIEQYRDVLRGGHAVVGVSNAGDNFNSFRQRGGAEQLGDPQKLGAMLEEQFSTFANNVTIEAQPRLFGDQPGIATSGRYDLAGTRHHLYQFSTAHGRHVYFFTVTLLTGPDQALADQVFSSISFAAS